jgi:hypothetical protein
VLKGVPKIQILNLYTNTKMKCVMCSPWKRTFTLVPLAPLTQFHMLENHFYLDFGFATYTKQMKPSTQSDWHKTRLGTCNLHICIYVKIWHTLNHKNFNWSKRNCRATYHLWSFFCCRSNWANLINLGLGISNLGLLNFMLMWLKPTLVIHSFDNIFLQVGLTQTIAFVSRCTPMQKMVIGTSIRWDKNVITHA